MSFTCAFSIPRTDCCCASMYARNAASIAFRKKIVPSTCHFRFPSYCGEPDEPVLTSERSATLFIASSLVRAQAPRVGRDRGREMLAAGRGTVIPTGRHERRFGFFPTNTRTDLVLRNFQRRKSHSHRH